MKYVSEPLSRNQLRDLAYRVRKTIGLKETLYFPVVRFMEMILPRIREDFQYNIVPIKEFPAFKHADFDISNTCVNIREDVYYNAVKGCGRDRMTIAHEIAHFLLIKIFGVKLNRIHGEQPAVYRDPEWQAKALAGEIMCPAHLIGGMNAELVSSKCGVSMAAASFAVNLYRVSISFYRPISCTMQGPGSMTIEDVTHDRTRRRIRLKNSQ